MAQEDVHDLDDAGLALGLSLGSGGGGASDAARHGTSSRLSMEAARVPPSPRALEPSLTLSMPDEATATGSGGGGGGGAAHSVSSLSVAGVKRERVDDAEAERASSTAAAAARAISAGAEDDDDGSTRKKLRLTKEQSALLEDRFKEHSTLNPKQKVALAKQLNLRPRQVEVWFQNRRASRARRTKLKQTEVDCELLKRCCESLTEENRRLQRELQELRALKFAQVHPQAPPSSAAMVGVPAPAAPPPFYMQMQLPAATLSLCPSCERLAGTAAAAKAEPDRPKAATHHFFNPFTHSAAC